MDARRILDFAAVVSACRRSAASHCSTADAKVGIGRHKCVGQIEELHTQLEFHTLRDWEVLHNGRVKLPESRPAQAVIEPGVGSRRISRKSLENGWVEI